jgi:septal ring factor EnvC (AmiA/AmiB activator)
MTHSPDNGDGASVFDREFLLLHGLVQQGSNPAMASLESDLKDAEFERKEAETKARKAEAQAKAAEGKAQKLVAQLEQTAAERDGLLHQLAEANARDGVLNETVSGLRFELGEAAGERDMLRAVLAQVVTAAMNGAADPLVGALDVLEAAGLPALVSRPRLAVAA